MNPGVQDVAKQNARMERIPTSDNDDPTGTECASAPFYCAETASGEGADAGADAGEEGVELGEAAEAGPVAALAACPSSRPCSFNFRHRVDREIPSRRAV